MSNKIILVVGVLLAGFGVVSLATVFYPRVLFYVQPKQLPYPSKYFSEKSVSSSLPKENRMVIPSIGVDSAISEGISEEALEKGVWLYPEAAKPGQMGNVVISGHRFLYENAPQNTLYNLDKVTVNDYILVYWQGREYGYRVTSTELVFPTDTHIQEIGETERLTVYTCAPLFDDSRRLVVYAEPI